MKRKFVKDAQATQVQQRPNVGQQQNEFRKFILVPTRNTGPSMNGSDPKLVQVVQSLGYSIQQRADGKYEVWR